MIETKNNFFLFYLNIFRSDIIFFFMARIIQIIRKNFTWICRDFGHAFFHAVINYLDGNFTASIWVVNIINRAKWNCDNEMVCNRRVFSYKLPFIMISTINFIATWSLHIIGIIGNIIFCTISALHNCNWWCCIWYFHYRNLQK